MRFVSIENIKEGMIVGRDIVDIYGNLLLRSGIVLNNLYIESLKKKNFNGIYIQDDISSEIIPSEIIPQPLKMKMVEALQLISEGEFNKDINISDIRNLIINVVEELVNTDAYLNIVELKSFDEYLYTHSVNTTLISLLIGIELKLSKKELYHLGTSALLHDIGKKFISKNILDKPGKLSNEEFEEIKQHTILGYKHARNMGFSLLVCSGILDHHEKYNGEGYPQKKKERQISFFGRIIAVADVYDALTSTRTYRKAYPPNEAFEYIQSLSGTHFDGRIVNSFVRRVFPYPIGTIVQLSNGMVGIVVKNNKELPLRPEVKVLKIDNVFIDTPCIIELTKHLNVTIVSSLGDI